MMSKEARYDDLADDIGHYMETVSRLRASALTAEEAQLALAWWSGAYDNRSAKAIALRAKLSLIANGENG